MPDFNLTPGSEYRVVSARTRDQVFEFEGTFQGITSLGSVDALVLEVDEESQQSKRLIPTHAILQIEVLDQAGEDDLDDEDSTMYT